MLHSYACFYKMWAKRIIFIFIAIILTIIFENLAFN